MTSTSPTWYRSRQERGIILNIKKHSPGHLDSHRGRKIIAFIALIALIIIIIALLH